MGGEEVAINMYWDQLTSPELHDLDRNIPVVLPIAATEQHGPHLPLATDRMIGEHFCQQLDLALPEKVLILPVVAVGCSEHHMEFAGSLTYRHETFLQLVEEVLLAVIHHGFQHILILNSHGGNQGIGQVVLEKIGKRHPACKLVLATWWRLAHEALSKLTESGPGGVGHAGEFETSLMMLIAPELVHTNKLVPGKNVATYPWAEGDMLRGAQAGFYRTMKEMTPNGVYGDPTFASPEKGKRITEVVTLELKQLIEDLFSSPS